MKRCLQKKYQWELQHPKLVIFLDDFSHVFSNYDNW
jgi:hypothetical protein